MLNDWSHKVRPILKEYCPGNIQKILPSSQSAWNTRFYFGHQKLCMDNNNNYIIMILDGSFSGDTIIFPSMLTILPSPSTRAILLTSLAIYSCIPLKAIQNYIIMPSGVFCDLNFTRR